jgi:ATP-dependent Clp protease ATP-binding subunit ClpA
MQIVALAEQRAKEFGQERVGAEHLLLALCEETEGVAARALRELDVAGTVSQRLTETPPRDPGAST